MFILVLDQIFIIFWLNQLVKQVGFCIVCDQLLIGFPECAVVSSVCPLNLLTRAVIILSWRKLWKRLPSSRKLHLTKNRSLPVLRSSNAPIRIRVSVSGQYGYVNSSFSKSANTDTL
ncbi:hypothetical protein VPH35_131503 [Triticum aestivum]